MHRMAHLRAIYPCVTLRTDRKLVRCGQENIVNETRDSQDRTNKASIYSRAAADAVVSAQFGRSSDAASCDSFDRGCISYGSRFAVQSGGIDAGWSESGVYATLVAASIVMAHTLDWGQVS